MATSYTQLKKGSRGDEVSELQTLLNNNGYSLDVDGIFGSKTSAAVKDYQSKNNLAVDGIVGTNTWGALTGSKSSDKSTAGDAEKTKTTADWLADYEGNKPAYEPSQAVKDAADRLANIETQKPGAYSGTYSEQIEQVLDQIMNRGEFKYDFNADPIYQQLKNEYVSGGQKAMRDTMGNAAALTGGYGSSYASTVGNQAYQSYLEGLTDKIPELYDAAYGRYMDEGDDMLNKLNVYTNMDEQEYDRSRDELNDYYNELDYYYGKYNDISADEYNKYLNDLNTWQADRDYWFNKQLAEQEQNNWQTELDIALGKLSGSSGSSGGSRRSGSGSGGNNGLPGLGDGNTGYSELDTKLSKMNINNFTRSTAEAMIAEATINGSISEKEGVELYGKYIKA